MRGKPFHCYSFPIYLSAFNFRRRKCVTEGLRSWLLVHRMCASIVEEQSNVYRSDCIKLCALAACYLRPTISTRQKCVIWKSISAHPFDLTLRASLSLVLAGLRSPTHTNIRISIVAETVQGISYYRVLCDVGHGSFDTHSTVDFITFQGESCEREECARARSQIYAVDNQNTNNITFSNGMAFVDCDLNGSAKQPKWGHIRPMVKRGWNGPLTTSLPCPRLNQSESVTESGATLVALHHVLPKTIW